MELQAQLSALEEEVGMLKGEIKAILQEVRVAILARQNPFLTDDLDRLAPTTKSMLSPFDLGDAPAALPVPLLPAEPAAQTIVHDHGSRVVKVADLGEIEVENAGPVLSSRKRPVDLAALMVWVQECAESFNHTEFVMLVTMASYADFFDDGLKQALLDMSEQVAREHTTKASLADFSLALKKLEAIRATTGRQRHAA
jgi:hypothetical protein